MRQLVILISLALVFGSCKKEEALLDRYFVYEKVGSADMQDLPPLRYQTELYFDLSTNSLKAGNKRDVWDLAFSGDVNRPNIFVNPANLCAVASTGSTDFNKSYNPKDYTFLYEHPRFYYQKGRMHSEFEEQAVKGEVFIIDMGYTIDNKKRGYKMLQLISYTNGKYTVKVSNTDKSDLKEFQVETNSSYNYQFVSLNNPNELLTLEPPKDEWDLHFCKYMERLWDGEDTLDYSVTGCLINPGNVSADIDTINSYYNLQAGDLNEAFLTTRQNIIGHEWKYYDLEKGYSVVDGLSYMIKEKNGQVYRFHFTGFQDGETIFEFLPF